MSKPFCPECEEDNIKWHGGNGFVCRVCGEKGPDLWGAHRAMQEALSARVAELEGALDASRIALDDWLHRYAPDLCGEPYVEDTRRRIEAAGGPLAYIADIQQRNRQALTPPMESDK